MTLFDAVGFRWDRSVVPNAVPTYSIERVCFRVHKMLSEFVWDAGVLEGNPLSFTEVMTVLDGITVRARKISDQEQIVRLAEGSKRLLAMVKSGLFELSKPVFTELNGIIARKCVFHPNQPPIPAQTLPLIPIQPRPVQVALCRMTLPESNVYVTISS